MIDIRKLKELVRLMVNHDLTEVDLRDTEEQVTLRRHSATQPPQMTSSSAQPMNAPSAAATSAGEAAAAPRRPNEAAAAAAVADRAGLVAIHSPMVGTFFAAASPDAAPFVTVGSTVGPETVVCLIEAMKIFNEIKAECAGTIDRVLVNNGESVEFGQALFLVKPA